MTLPMVDLVAQIPPPAYYPPPVFDDPDVDRYCRTTGPDIGLTPRTIFREVGRYVDPATGICKPPMQVIADALRTSKGTVQRAVVTWTLGGLVEVEKVKTANGRDQNVYYYTGHRDGFVPAFMAPRGELSHANFQLKELTAAKQRIAALEAKLAQFVDLDTGEIAGPEPVPEIRYGRDDQNWDKEEEGRRIVPILNSDIDSFPLPSAQIPIEAFSLDAPPDTFNEAYVTWAVEQFEDWKPPNGWHSIKAATTRYKADWPKFVEDLARHHATVDHAPIAAGMFRCAGCKEIKTTLDSCGGLCGRCKAEKEYRNRPVHRSSMLSTT